MSLSLQEPTRVLKDHLLFKYVQRNATSAHNKGCPCFFLGFQVSAMWFYDHTQSLGAQWFSNPTKLVAKLPATGNRLTT